MLSAPSFAPLPAPMNGTFLGFCGQLKAGGTRGRNRRPSSDFGLDRNGIHTRMIYEQIEYQVRASLGRNEWVILVYYPDNADGKPTTAKFTGRLSALPVTRLITG